MAEVVKKQGGALVNASFEEMSGLGFAETTTQDMSIPFLIFEKVFLKIPCSIEAKLITNFFFGTGK